MENPKKSIYSFAASGGLYMGLLMSALCICLYLSLDVQMASAFMIPLMLAVPVLLWKLLADMCREVPEYGGFFSLWLAGIYIFLFGSLIAGLASLSYLTFVNPDYVSCLLSRGISEMQAQGMTMIGDIGIDTIKADLAAHRLPFNRVDLTMLGMWTTCFGGAMLSLLEAAVMYLTKERLVFRR